MRRQIPTHPIVPDPEPVLHLQMPPQDFGAKPALEAYHILWAHRLSDRHRRLAPALALAGRLGRDRRTLDAPRRSVLSAGLVRSGDAAHSCRRCARLDKDRSPAPKLVRPLTAPCPLTSAVVVGLALRSRPRQDDRGNATAAAPQAQRHGRPLCRSLARRGRVRIYRDPYTLPARSCRLFRRS